MTRRASTLRAVYVKHTVDIDRNYVGTVAGEVGPVEGKLNDFELRGLVFDAFGEASEDVHSLIKGRGEVRVPERVGWKEQGGSPL